MAQVAEGAQIGGRVVQGGRASWLIRVPFEKPAPRAGPFVGQQSVKTFTVSSRTGNTGVYVTRIVDVEPRYEVDL